MAQSLIHTQPLYQQVYKIIRGAILSGEIKPGNKVVVTQLAQKYNISRTPLREALRQLQIEGLLVQKSSGLAVISLDRKDFEELYQCRLILEKEMMKVVAETITAKRIAEIEKILHEANEAYVNKDYLQLLDLNSQFHDRLIEESGNNRAVHLLKQVRSFLLIYRANILKDEKQNLEVIQEHQQIITALKQKNEQLVSQLIEEHICKDMERGKKMFAIN